MRKPQNRDDGEVILAPVESIIGVWQFYVLPKHRQHRSLPGHMIHLIVTGDPVYCVQGKRFSTHPGDLIYYYESEEIEGLKNKKPYRAYSIGFIAPDLPPFSLERRVFASTPAIRQLFKQLYATYRLPTGLRRTIRLHARLMSLLEMIQKLDRGIWKGTDSTRGSWWSLEQELRRRHLFRPTLEDMTAIAGWSRRTAGRRCRSATGTSPMQRLRQVRMAEARGLLQFSKMNIGEVATYLGYPRLHEFSREFSRHFGVPPSRIPPLHVRTPRTGAK